MSINCYEYEMIVKLYVNNIVEEMTYNSNFSGYRGYAKLNRNSIESVCSNYFRQYQIPQELEFISGKLKEDVKQLISGKNELFQ